MMSGPTAASGFGSMFENADVAIAGGDKEVGELKNAIKYFASYCS